MNKNTVKITYAEPWLPFHHRLFINIVETCSARIALKKRYDSYTNKVKNKKGNQLWDQAIESLGIIKPNFSLPQKNKKKGLVIAANHPFGVTDGVFLAWIASRIDPNFKVIAHGILQKERSLAHSILPIDFSNSKNAMRNNVIVRRNAIKALEINIDRIKKILAVLLTFRSFNKGISNTLGNSPDIKGMKAINPIPSNNATNENKMNVTKSLFPKIL